MGTRLSREVRSEAHGPQPQAPRPQSPRGPRRDGLLRWTGRWRNGEKVYKVTDAGREWARKAADDDSEGSS